MIDEGPVLVRKGERARIRHFDEIAAEMRLAVDEKFVEPRQRHPPDLIHRLALEADVVLVVQADPHAVDRVLHVAAGVAQVILRELLDLVPPEERQPDKSVRLEAFLEHRVFENPVHAGLLTWGSPSAARNDSTSATSSGSDGNGIYGLVPTTGSVRVGCHRFSSV